jgi:hypothetical protein
MAAGLLTHVARHLLTEVVHAGEKTSLNSAKVVNPASHHALHGPDESLNLNDHHL